MIFKTKKAECCLQLLAPEIMKLFGSTKNKITEGENGENVLVVLVHLILINRLFKYLMLLLKIFCF